MRIRCSLVSLVILVVCIQLAYSSNFRRQRRDDVSSISAHTSSSQHTSSSIATTSHKPSSTPAPTSATTTSHATTSAPSESSAPSAFHDQPINNGTASNADPLPLTPKLTPGLGIAGVVLLISGTVYCVVGIRSKWLYIFGSAAYLSSLGVVVLICYLMNPPVTAAVQGAYFIAAFFTGLIVGALALIFKDLTEGLGCLLGGFCLAMWFLVLKPDGLIGSQGGKAIFIGVMSLAAFALSFSHYTRHYGLIVCVAFAGSTITVLGIDCFARAGMKEFWLWLWELNDNAFPLNTNHYPQTRGLRAEIAGIILICCAGIISQLKLWKLVKERRRRKDADRMEHQENLDRIDSEVGRRVQDESERERIRWEAAYANKDEKDQPSISVKELGSMTDTLEMSQLSGSGASTAPTSWRGSVEHRHQLSNVHEEDEIMLAPNGLVVPPGSSRRLSAPTSRSSSGKGSSEKARGSYFEERATLRTSMPPPPPMINMPFNPTTGTLDAVKDEQGETGTTLGLLEESTLSRRLSKRNSGGIRKSGSFRSAKSNFSNRQNSASQEDLLVPHDDDQRSSVAATLDILDEDRMSIRSRLDSEHGEGMVTNIRPATADREKLPGTDGLLNGEHSLSKAPRGFLAPRTEPVSASGSESGASKRLSGVSIADEDDDEELRPPVVSHEPNSTSSAEVAPASAELVAEQLPDKLSKIALSYRTNEWAKHLEAADVPEMDALPPEPESPGIQVDPTFAESVRKESAGKPLESIQGVHAPTTANVQADGVKAASPPLNRRETGPDTSRLRGSAAMPTSIAPQLSRNTSSTSVNQSRSTAQQAMRSDPNLLKSISRSASSSTVNLQKKMKRTSSMPLVDENAAMQANTPSNTLVGKRESMTNRRVSTMSFAGTNASTPKELNVIGPSEPALSRPASRRLLSEAPAQLQDGDVPLSQRREQVKAKRRSSGGPPLTSPPMPPIRSPSSGALPSITLQEFNSHQPQRGPSHVDPNRREAMLAHWRQSLQQDTRNVQEVQNVNDDNRRMQMLSDKKQREAWVKHEEAQKKAAERERDSFMRSGNMIDAHQKAMKRMQEETRRRSGI